MIPLGTFLLYVFLGIVALVLAFIFVRGFWKVFLVVFVVVFGLLLRREIAGCVTSVVNSLVSWFK